MKLYAPLIREATLRVTMTLRSEGHGGMVGILRQNYRGAIIEEYGA